MLFAAVSFRYDNKQQARRFVPNSGFEIIFWSVVIFVSFFAITHPQAQQFPIETNGLARVRFSFASVGCNARSASRVATQRGNAGGLGSFPKGWRISAVEMSHGEACHHLSPTPQDLGLEQGGPQCRLSAKTHHARQATEQKGIQGNQGQPTKQTLAEPRCEHEPEAATERKSATASWRSASAARRGRARTQR